MEIFAWILVGFLIGGLVTCTFFWLKIKKEPLQHEEHSGVNTDNVNSSVEEAEEKSEKETEYRIIHYKKDYYVDTKWLQYKDEVGVWRCVPEQTFGTVCGPKPGYSSMDDASPVSSISCYEGRESELRAFTEKWPCISKYFGHLSELHKKYINKKEEEKSKNGQIENL